MHRIFFWQERTTSSFGRFFGDKASRRLYADTEIWQVGARELGILSLRIVAENARRLGARYNPSEGILPVQAALPYVEEYVSACPGNEVETEVLRDMRNMLQEG